MTDILWVSTEENVNWGEWKEVDRLPLGHRITRWWQKKMRGYRYVIGLSWPEVWRGRVGDGEHPEYPAPLMEAVFGPVAQAQQQVIALLAVKGAIRGDICMIAVSESYELAKAKLWEKRFRTKPIYEVSRAYPVTGGFEAVYTPID